MMSRERRTWTAQEDELLRMAVETEDTNPQNPSRWFAIAKHVPNRTNKDCRKRWFSKMAPDIVRGAWTSDEDDRLVRAVQCHGVRWSLVARAVGTRNTDQCAKRWNDTLNPTIDRSVWTSDADSLLQEAVQRHGKHWSLIVKTYFPGRTGLSAKNRYNSITRFDGRRPHVSTKASSSTSSPSLSPVTPPMSKNLDAIPSTFMRHTTSLPSWMDMSPSPMVPDDVLAFAAFSPYGVDTDMSQLLSVDVFGAFSPSGVDTDLSPTDLLGVYRPTFSFATATNVKDSDMTDWKAMGALDWQPKKQNGGIMY